MKAKTEKQKGLLKTVIIGGMMVGASTIGTNAESLFSYGDMGSGAEVRSNLLEQYGSPVNTANLPSDFVVGESKCGEEKSKATKKEAKKTESKTTEGKCGEGKCGS